ncbi:unannotated protein [freshwater metagenome]|uniref:Unannotated protein n=1 Tax=freshwater metagenome TaxID=449393 RepID=A0A6J6YXM6_9ZZZZ
MLFSQTVDQDTVNAGKVAAQKLGLLFEHRHVGLKHFAEAIPVLYKSMSKLNETKGE